MPRGFLRSVTTSRGWRMTMEKMPVQRSVLARLPFVQVCSLHFTWKELSEIRTTLVTSTETLRSPTTLKGSLRRAQSYSTSAQIGRATGRDRVVQYEVSTGGAL